MNATTTPFLLPLGEYAYSMFNNMSNVHYSEDGISPLGFIYSKTLTISTGCVLAGKFFVAGWNSDSTCVKVTRYASALGYATLVGYELCAPLYSKLP